MGKIDSWITKITRLKNSKVARFSYKAEAYANDDIEGVENYDYSRDMNIPLATHTDFDPDVLSIGARTQFSSVTKNGLNHFFGRVSYNLNKVLDFLSDFLDDFISFTEIVSFSSSATLSNYADGSTKRLLNTAGSTITITLPVGETYLGSNTILLAPSIMLTITKRGTVWLNSSGNAITAITADKWKTARNITITDADGTNTGAAVSVDGSENETLKLPPTIKANLTGNASTATLATQANELKPLGNSITLPATPTSVTKIIKIATVSYTWAGTIKIRAEGNGAYDNVSLHFGQRSDLSGVQVTYSKYYMPQYGINKIIVTRDGTGGTAPRNIYIEFANYPNYGQIITLGVVETNQGTFTPSMTEVSSVEGTVLDSVSLDYTRGDISSYQHVFTKNIIGDITGNASTADKWKTARTITISDADGTNTGIAVSVDGSENETLKLPPTIKANLIGNASKANVRVSLRHGTTWFSKTWGGLTDFNGLQVWTDGENIYFSDGTKQYVLNKSNSTWFSKTWGGLTDFDSLQVWTDGENIYFSDGTKQYVLNKSNSTWSPKTWTGLTNFYGREIWTDGENIYYSREGANYVLNKSNSTWSPKTWTGLTNFYGREIWTDGENIYYSGGTKQYVLNKSNSTWSSKTWTGLTDFYGSQVWADGGTIYYSDIATQYVLNKTNSTWSPKTWIGLTNFRGYYVWTDGDNIYYSSTTNHYVLPATRHNYVDDNKYQGLFGVSTSCRLKTLSKEFVFSNE